MQLNKQQILEIVNKQLLLWIKKDETVKDAVFDLVNTKYPTKKETDDKFEKMLKELANDREVQSRKWEEQKLEDNRKWEEQKLEDNKKWEEQNKKWEEQKLEDNRKWEEQNKKWEEQNKKWEENKLNINKILKENRENIDKVLDEIKAMNRKHEQSIGGIGARWGIRSEISFRNALTGILEIVHSEYEITHYNEHDSEGIVYGEPQDVEIDIIMQNGNVYLIEISSNIKFNDIFTFIKKIKFYEKQHKQKVHQLLIISPWIDERNKKLAEEKGFKIFSFMEDVKL